MATTSNVGPMRLPVSTAQRIAERIVEELTPMCERIEIAGSIRRRRSMVGDIDIVLLPKPDCLVPILDRATAKTRPIKKGPQYVVLEMTNGFQIDLWIAHAGKAEEKDMLGGIISPERPGNFGMLLLSRTGSYTHNIFLCQQATALGLHLHPHVGITSGGIVVASETEEAIFKVLKMTFVPPERRER